MRSIIWLITVAFLFIITIPLVIVLWIIQLFRSPYKKPLAGTRFVTEILVPFAAWLGGCDLEIIGKENLPDESQKPYVFTGNHQGNFDTLLVQYALGVHKITMTKYEAIFVPFANLWMCVLRCVFVKRKDPRQAVKCMEKTMDYVRHGRSVLYFPEGTRSHGPEMGRFKPGAFRCASETGTDIVPFVIDGTWRVYEEKKKLVKAKVFVSILPPVKVTEGEDPKELCERVKALIQSELDKLHGDAVKG